MIFECRNFTIFYETKRNSFEVNYKHFSLALCVTSSCVIQIKRGMGAVNHNYTLQCFNKGYATCFGFN